MNRNFALEFVRVCEAAALSSARFMGKGDEKKADHAAVEAMRSSFNTIQFNGVVRIGEGERDKAPMLYIGEKVGCGDSNSLNLDLAVDPLEGTKICAKGGQNALSVIAVAEEGCLLEAPDCYMEKIAVGRDAAGVIDLDAPIVDNLKAVASKKKCSVADLSVAVLDRLRHEKLICDIRDAGARIWLIGDGDVQAALSTTISDSGIDMLVGIGGAPEGVIAAAALKCVGGDFQGRLNFTDSSQRERAIKMGIKDPDKRWTRDDIARGPVMFCATGVTHGSLLKGVRFSKNVAKTHSLVMRSETGTIRFIEAQHDMKKKPLSEY
jgi:fructose-1,6-bisphosphatase class II